MKFGVVQFPGSNCDDDAYHAIGAVIGSSPSNSSGTNPSKLRALTRSFCRADLRMAIICARGRLRDFRR